VSGEAVAGVAVIGAIGGVVVLGAAAAAGCAYVAGAGTALVVGGSMAAIGRHLEHRQEERAALYDERIRWESGIREVASRNARIGALQAVLSAADADLAGTPLAETERAGAGPVRLPAPLVLGRQVLADLERWCEQTDATLAEIEPEVIGRSTAALLLRASSGGAGPQALTGAEAVLGDDDPDSGGPAARVVWDRGPLLVDLARIVGRLAVEASETNREMVTAAAQRVLTARSRTEARNRLGDVRVRLDQANAVAVERQRQAIQAAALLQPLAQADGSAEPLRAALRDVVAGRRELTADLSEQAERITAAVQHDADRQYLRQSVTEALAELGYDVEEGFQTAVPQNGRLQIRRSEWSAHGVRMILDESKQELRAVVVRTEADTGWDQSRVDVEREQQWCADLDRLAEGLAAKGISYQVRTRSEVGAKALPVVAAPEQTSATRPASAVRQVGPGQA
jgi:hypothetical protein